MHEREFEPVVLSRALREMTEVFRAIFEQQHQLAAVLACDGTLLDANRRALELVGAERDDVVGRPFGETPWWSHSPVLQRRLRDAIAAATKGETVRFDAEHPRAEGGMATVRFSLRPVRDDDGVVAYLVAEAVDISELRHAEGQVERERSEHQALADAVPVAIAFVDREERYRFHNRTHATWVGRDPGEIIGERVRDVLGDEVYGVVAAQLERALNGERANFRGTIAYRGIGARECQIDYFPHESSEGSCDGAYVVIGDRTDEIFADRELRLHEARLRSLVGATQDAVVFIDGHARIASVNESTERMFGYDKGELTGEKVEVLMPEPYRSEHDGYISRYENTGEARAVGRIRRVEAVRKNGDVFPIELSVTKLAVDDEVRYAAFIRDVSVSAELHRQVLHAEKLATIGATTAKLAHEIGNPLNNLTIQARLLERRMRALALTDDSLDECIASVRGELGRLGRLLDEFRLLARRDTLHPSSCDLGQLVTRVAHMAQTLGGEVEVTVNVDPLPPISVDADKITQVLLNLAKNAVEAMPGGGRLGLAAKHIGDHIEVELTDTGSGIPSGVDVFEPFVTTKPTGTGLGLPVAQQIIAAHGGALHHEVPDGGGTRFVVRLPLEPA